MGQILKCNIYRVDAIRFEPLQLAKLMPRDISQMAMLEKIIKEKAMYFSYDYNLTQSSQHIINGILGEREEWKVQELKKEEEGYWSDIDTNFAFNRPHLNFRNLTLHDKFFVTCIYGYVYIHSLHFDAKKVDYVLISRKDVRRLGRRFTCRGADKDGSVANFVETEQLIIDQEAEYVRVCAYLQTRGSIPLLWTQTPNLKWSPTLKISSDSVMNEKVASLHLEEQVNRYKENILVNLIDKKGSQNRIGEAFTKIVEKVDHKHISYTWFDFHHECRKMKWENIGLLIDEIKERMESFDYFMANLEYGLNEKEKLNTSTCMVLCNQVGVVRTNCMDCLDRTNVVQSVIGRNIAHKQFYKMNILNKPKGTTFE